MKDKIVAIKNKPTNYAIAVLVIFHIIGLGLFLYPDRVEGLSGLNVLLCSLLLFMTAANRIREAFLLAFIFLGGFLVEYVGVNTGLLFGEYAYGEELGWKIGGVPYVLGLNWYCVVAAAAHLINHYWEDRPLLAKAALVGLFCVAMDYLIEPVAIAYDFWSWGGGDIPVFNYICWGVFATIFAAVYFMNIKKINPVAYSLYGIWIIFFGILNII